jgi:hypothetical protein
MHGKFTAMTDFDLSGFRSGPMTLMWQTPHSAAELVTFDHAADWQRCVRGFTLQSTPPQIVTRKFQRALTLYELAWFSYDVFKPAELAALAALELALLNHYGTAAKPARKPRKGEDVVRASFSELLRHMVEKDGLTPRAIASLARNKVSEIGPVFQNLLRIRNGLAHGDPFDGQHQVGLIELVRDLIDYAYRTSI